MVYYDYFTLNYFKIRFWQTLNFSNNLLDYIFLYYPKKINLFLKSIFLKRTAYYLVLNV